MPRSVYVGLLLPGILFAALADAEEAKSPTVVDLGGGGRVLVHAGARASVKQPSWVPPESGAKSVRADVVSVRDGELTVRLPADGSKTLMVTSANGQNVLIWRGSAHVVVHGRDMRVALDDGAAYAGAENSWMRMTNASAVAMDVKATPRAYRRRLAPPEPTSCGEGALRLSTATSDKLPARVCWSPVDGASGYRVEIARDAAMAELVDVVDVGKELGSAEMRLPPGRYHTRVLALSSDGIPGLASRVDSLHLVRAVLPPDAVVAADGAIVLPKDGAVTIDPDLTVVSSGGEDLERATATASGYTVFTPAPAAFTLQGQAARMIRVRDESGAEARLALVGQTLRAHVSMTPRQPRWPHDPIDVAVTLGDPGGRIDPASAPVELAVLVDSKPVVATWTREGNVARTRIAPLDGPGPWFVRVVARDKAGDEIGSYIVDVDGPKRREAIAGLK